MADYHEAGLTAGAECLRAALDYRDRGWAALIVCPPDHVGVGRAHGQNCQCPGKAPWGAWAEYQERLPVEDELRRKWRDLPNANVGMAYGPVSGLIGIDVDGPGGEELLRQKSGGNLPRTLQFCTGGNGRRYLYAIPPGAKLRTTSQQTGLHQELRFQAKGSQTVMPPSRHPSGRRYVWEPGHGPDECEAAPAPAWLMRELATPDPKQRKSAAPVADRIVEGGRDAALASLGGTMRRRGMGQEAILAALLVENEAKCEPPLPEEQVRKVAASVARYAPGTYVSANGTAPANGPVQKSEAPLTDLGNGRRFAADHGRVVRFCHPWNKWLIWDERRWRLDETGAAKALAKQTVLRLYAWAKTEIDQLAEEDSEEGRVRLKAVKAVLTWALKSQDARRLSAMLDLAKSERDIPILPDVLDLDPYLLNVLNGTIDLRTGNLRPHNPADYLTKLAPVEFDPDATCPTWERFIFELFDGSEPIVGYMQRLCGYWLTGLATEHVLPVRRDLKTQIGDDFENCD